MLRCRLLHFLVQSDYWVLPILTMKTHKSLKQCPSLPMCWKLSVWFMIIITIRSYEQVSFLKHCESLWKVKKVPWFLTSTTLEPGWSRKFLYVREAQKMSHDFWDQVQVSKHSTVILHSTVCLSLLMFKGYCHIVRSTWENRTFCCCNLLSELCLHMVTNKYLNMEH